MFLSVPTLSLANLKKILEYLLHLSILSMNIPNLAPFVPAGHPVSLSIGTAKIVLFQYRCSPPSHFFFIFLLTRCYSARKNLFFFVFCTFATPKSPFFSPFPPIFWSIFRAISEHFQKKCEKASSKHPIFEVYFGHYLYQENDFF